MSEILENCESFRPYSITFSRYYKNIGRSWLIIYTKLLGNTVCTKLLKVSFRSLFEKYIQKTFSNMFDAIVGTSLANIAKEAFLNGQSVCTEVYALVL